MNDSGRLLEAIGLAERKADMIEARYGAGYVEEWYFWELVFEYMRMFELQRIAGWRA